MREVYDITLKALKDFEAGVFYPRRVPSGYTARYFIDSGLDFTDTGPASDDYTQSLFRYHIEESRKKGLI